MKLEDYKKEFARLGGEAVKKKYGKKHYIEMNKKSVEARKKKKELQT